MDELMPGFIQILRTHAGDYWVVDDIRVIGVHLASEDDDGAAHRAAMEHAASVSDNGCYASYGLGTVPRCHVSNFLHGYPGSRPGADPAWACMRGGWFDDDEEDSEDDALGRIA